MFSCGYVSLIGVPRTAIVCPPAFIVASCAAVSMPAAKPDTTVTLSLARSAANLRARRIPSSLALRLPTRATRCCVSRRFKLPR